MPLLIALVLSAVSQNTKEDLLAIEMARHAGNWAVESFEYDGTAAAADVARSISREVRGDHVTWRRDGKPFSGTTMSVEIDKDPRRITVVPEGGQVRDKPVRGIYKLEGDKLTLCMAEPGDPAPKKFTAAKGTRYTLVVLRRAPAVGRPRRR